MGALTILVVSENDLTNRQERLMDRLERQCFSNIRPETSEEFFYAESFSNVLAYTSGETVGFARLFKRKIEFDGRELTLGGIGGICVAEQERRRGIATKMIKTGLEVLKDEKCDVACLTTEPSLYPLFEKMGFKLMRRRISFEDAHGKIRYDKGAMFVPICSREIYAHIMSSRKTFHYGKGYW